MRLPLEWLREYVDPGLATDALAEALIQSGTIVEDVHELGVSAANGNLDNFRIGRVVSVEQHPNADRLRVCQVDLGEPQPRQIVCGAPNVAAGQTVGVALPGAVLPGNEPLETATLRGVESSGMILSARELELGDDHSGIMVLADDLAPGASLSGVLAISETVLELELTSNRPDCMAIYGMAREVHAATGAPLADLDVSEPHVAGAGTIADYVSLTVEAPDLCPRYMARVLTDVPIGPSPAWMQARIEAAGMRAINNVVDITNYVMLLTGQPLHAFDLDRMAGPAVVVRRATQGESATTLDGQVRALDPSMLVICDAERPAVIAGIMGAEDVEVSEATTRLLLEAATFDGPTTLRTALALGLRSESSARFEKRLPVELPARAMAIASRLLVELCGAKLVPGTLDVGASAGTSAPVRLRHARLDAVLGMPTTPQRSQEILERLDFRVAAGVDEHMIEAPFERRNDVTREADLIEEVGRIQGFEALPELLPAIVGQGRRTPPQALRDRLGCRAADLGFSEVVTYRFVPEADADRLMMAADDPRRQVVRLANPLSDEMAVMRRSMLPGLLRAAAHNQAHQRPSGRLFEIGRTYAPRGDGLADEPEFFAGLVFGPSPKAHWRAPAATTDIHLAVGLAGALVATAGCAVTPHGNSAPYFHPVRQARLMADGHERPIGWAGEVHPLVLRAFGVSGPAAAIVLDLGSLLEVAPTAPRAFVDIISVPVATRDLALVVDEAVRAADLIATAHGAGVPLVRHVELFDHYVGEQVEMGTASVALRLVLADPGRTLTDEEISGGVAAVVAALTEQHGAHLR